MTLQEQITLIDAMIKEDANQTIRDFKEIKFEIERIEDSNLEYKPIEDFPQYLIYKNGDIFSVKRQILLAPRFSVDGYRRVCLCKNGIMKNFSNHILVALTFISEKPFKDAEVNHKDGNKLNNHVSNLEWCSKLENMRHAKKNGLRPSYEGDNNPAAKLHSSDIPVIKRLLSEGNSLTTIADIYKVSFTLISKIKRGKLWKTA